MQSKKFNLICFLIIVLSLISKVVIMNYLSLKGPRLIQLEKRKEELVEENLSLKIEIARVSSLEYIKSQAESLGLISARLDFLTIPSLASKP